MANGLRRDVLVVNYQIFRIFRIDNSLIPIIVSFLKALNVHKTLIELLLTLLVLLSYRDAGCFFWQGSFPCRIRIHEVRQLGFLL